MTLEGCAHIFEGCSQIMLRDCPWMMLEAEKNDVTRLFPEGTRRLFLDDVSVG